MNTLKSLALVSLIAISPLSNAQNSVEHASAGSKHSLLASGHGLTASGQVASAAVAIPVIAGASVVIASAAIADEVGDALVQSASSKKQAKGAFVITEITVTAEPSPAEAMKVKKQP
ncbi:hypothetical protein [Thalassotalea marina]|uniref:Uncharacterized protein n=1 Tax=Thalassotalea marina TaxID=1673741 RepID=A0A919BLW9_9GAMM|nr:hypothetical protein [Thalassotalea marina]GHF96184.1 hypothetical protein GCM10017161_25670 [Thalassotalea marina]